MEVLAALRIFPGNRTVLTHGLEDWPPAFHRTIQIFNYWEIPVEVKAFCGFFLSLYIFTSLSFLSLEMHSVSET